MPILAIVFVGNICLMEDFATIVRDGLVSCVRRVFKIAVRGQNLTLEALRKPKFGGGVDAL